MPAPGIVAAGIAAARAVGGIMGKGSKNVNPVYKNQFTSEKGLAGLKKISDKSKKQKAIQNAKDKKDGFPPPPPGAGALYLKGYVPNASGAVKVKYNKK